MQISERSTPVSVIHCISSAKWGHDPGGPETSDKRFISVVLYIVLHVSISKILIIYVRAYVRTYVRTHVIVLHAQDKKGSYQVIILFQLRDEMSETLPAFLRRRGIPESDIMKFADDKVRTTHARIS